MRVSPHQPVVYAAPQRRIRFAETVRVKHYTPGPLPAETYEAARLKHRLNQVPLRPIIRPPPPPPVKPVARSGSTSSVFVTAGAALLVIGIVSPIALGVIAAALIIGIGSVALVNKYSKPECKKFTAAINKNALSKSSTLDLRNTNFDSLPDYLYDFCHLRRIIVTREQAARIKAWHGKAKIYIGR